MQYYLSVYMEVPDLTALAVMRHDQSAALWVVDRQRVELVRYWEFERVSGLKHHRLPIRDPAEARDFLGSLLAEEGLEFDDLSAVWGTRLIETEAVGSTLPADICVHTASHVLSSVLLDWEVFRSQDILALAMDAGPDMHLELRRPTNIYTGAFSCRGRIEMFPIESPGPLWLLARGKFGREEGTLMALASATTCRIEFDVDEIANRLAFWSLAGSFESANVLLSEASAEVERVLATESGRSRAGYDERFSAGDNLQSAVMKIVDALSSVIVHRNIDRAIEQFELAPHSTWLGLSGGFALNGPTNTRAINHYGFKGMLAPPCVDDSGQALGIGLLGLHELGLTSDGEFRLAHAYHGRDRLDENEALRRFDAAIESVEPVDLERAVDDLVDGPVAWVFGPAEIGPRALGHRSLLGDPRSEATKTIVNAAKRRQWWRPVAPAVLESELGEWFVESRPSPFMLEVYTARPDRRENMPAVVHLDGTARVQTVDRSGTRLAQLLEAFQARTGVPILANTSLNDQGEPLVDSAAEALNFCIRRGIRVAYIGDHRIELHENAIERLPLVDPEPRRSGHFDDTAAKWAAHWKEWFGLGLTVEDLHVWAWNPDLTRRVDPRTPEGARVLRRIAPIYLSRMTPIESSYIHHISAAFGPDSDLVIAAESNTLIGGFYADERPGSERLSPVPGGGR